MINLMPDDHKSEIRAARTNVLLVRYILMLLSAIVVLSGLIVGSYIVLNSARDSAQIKVNENQQNVSKYQATKSSAEAFRADLATAKSILDQNVSFSKLIYKIADSIPPGVVLTTLTLDPKTFGTKMTLSANAKSFSAATQLKESFTKNQELFSNVQLQSIQSGESNTDGSNAYPFTVSISFIINKGATQ